MLPPQCCGPEDNNEIMVQAEFHQEPKKMRPALQPVRRMITHCNINPAVQLTESREHQQLAEQFEVPEDNGAKNGNTKKVTKMNNTDNANNSKRRALCYTF